MYSKLRNSTISPIGDMGAYEAIGMKTIGTWDSSEQFEFDSSYLKGKVQAISKLIDSSLSEFTSIFHHISYLL